MDADKGKVLLEKRSEKKPMYGVNNPEEANINGPSFEVDKNNIKENDVKPTPVQNETKEKFDSHQKKGDIRISCVPNQQSSYTKPIRPIINTLNKGLNKPLREVRDNQVGANYDTMKRCVTHQPLSTLPRNKNFSNKNLCGTQQKGTPKQSELMKCKSRCNQGSVSVQSQSHILQRRNSWHGNRYGPLDETKYLYNTSDRRCSYRPPKKPAVSWIPCSEGRVQPAAIVAGQEDNNPYTFFGRVTLRDERFEFIV